MRNVKLISACGIFILVFLSIFLSFTTGAASNEIYGTWSLVSFAIKDTATGKTTDAFGKNPKGFINYGRDGRMMVLIVQGERPKPVDLSEMTDAERAQLFKTCISYGGTYTFNGTTVTHHVDISWNENWTGTEQVRNVAFEGKRLILSTNPMPSPIDGSMGVGMLVWERNE
jgi:hypothetical protein